ncbi:winged helix-turn-helix transcriptional regulator [Mediterraneibacter sp. NSJ-55]|uniref:Winged helix-turn-helix transcriptional regulator n=1 Tax=Mediterraneibacter hominis TaxID=2763054 RepID=A0A923RQK9_9FIRM|nr:winged helix-turn-helix transcriptional regulator [Mediterraneibacter hominis]MBC5689611.1 winged helix-turn-helix transcriptional regulator [Mediterraneibacter hominis]
MDQNKDELMRQVWENQDIAYNLMNEYDEILRCYGEYVLYQAEGLVIDLIAAHPGITCTDIAHITNKTASACSQIVRKLRERNWVCQIRNEENNRKFNLELTEIGREICEERKHFTKICQDRMFDMLSIFTEEELMHHIQVQKKINEAYREDIRQSKEGES